MFTDLLTQSGLSKKEALVYEKLLGLGLVPANKIIKATGLKRGTVYDILSSLEEKGLVSQEKKQAKRFFWAEHPQKLYDYLDRRVEKMKSVRGSLDNLLPKLTSEYKMSLHKPVVSYYEGRSGIRKIFQDIYSPKDDVVYGCVDLEKADEAFPSYIIKDLIPKRIRNKLFAKTFVAKSKKSCEIAKKDKEQLRETTLVNKQKYPLPAEIDVYQDKIAMLSFGEDKFVGIIIQNKDLAESMRSIFKLAFENQKNIG